METTNPLDSHEQFVEVDLFIEVDWSADDGAPPNGNLSCGKREDVKFSDSETPTAQARKPLESTTSSCSRQKSVVAVAVALSPGSIPSSPVSVGTCSSSIRKKKASVEEAAVAEVPNKRRKSQPNKQSKTGKRGAKQVATAKKPRSSKRKFAKDNFDAEEAINWLGESNGL